LCKFFTKEGKVLETATVDNLGNVYVGKLLRKFRKEILKVSQVRLSIDLCVDRSYISKWENNIEPKPRYYIKILKETYKNKSINLVQAYITQEASYYETM
jgi:predicted transcriptional regulator